MRSCSIVVLALFALLTSQSATAGVLDYEVITESTSSNSDGLKSLLVDCPAGKQLLAGGARIFGSIDGTALTTSGPEGPPSTPTGWYGVATEVVPTSSSWGLRVDAICGEVDGYEVITDSTSSNSNDLRSLLVDCPAGKLLLGGGTRIFGSIDGTALTTSGPEGPPSTPTGWYGVAIEVVPTSSSWGVRVDAICGQADGYEVITESTSSSSNDLRSLLVDCPMGKRLLAGGTRIFGSIDGTALTTSGPEGPPSAPTGWYGVATEVVSTSSSWGVRVDTFCVPEPSPTLLGVTALGLLGLLRRAARPLEICRQ